MYQALYRKYRPQTFDDVIGQDHITKTLKNQVMTDRLSHAYIFIGTRGTGKTTCARILAKAVNCEHPKDGNPCLECASCKGIADGSVMDIVELDAASNNGVDNVRSLRDEAVFSPANAKKRVYIIDEVHMLSTPAFNALLKILEEPPEHLMFVLATTELQKVPATILSRCQRHAFKRVATDELAAYLESIAGKEHIDLSHDAAVLLAGLGEGSVRDCLSLLDQCSAFEHIGVDEVYNAVGLAGNKRITSLFTHIAAGRPEEALSEFNAMWVDGKDPAVVLKELSNLSRDILMMKVAPKNGAELVYGGYDREVMKQLASQMSIDELCRIGEKLTKTVTTLGNPKLDTELALIRLASRTEEEELSAPAAVKIGSRQGSVPEHHRAPAPEKPKVIPQPDVPEDSPPWKEAPPIEEPPEIPVRQVTEQTKIEQEEEPEQPSPTPAEKPEKEQKSVSKDPSTVWKAIVQVLHSRLSGIDRFIFDDPSTGTGSVEGSVLKLQVIPGIYYDRLNKPQVLQTISDAASEVCGSPIMVKLTELKDPADAKPQRSIEELRQFSEVKFK